MAQSDVCEFLKQHQGEWFTAVQIAKALSLHTAKKSSRRISGLCGVTSELRFNGIGNRMSIYYSYLPDSANRIKQDK